MGQLDVKLDDIELFVEVVRAKSFSGAARKLGIPKSTVSRRVSELEERLQSRLLERTTRSLRLTELGMTYFERAAHHIDDLKDASRALVEQDNEPRGTLKVTAPADVRMAASILRYQARYPKVNVVLYGASHRVDLFNEDFDLAIRAGHLDDSSLVARQIAVSRRWLVAAPSYLAQAPPLIEPADLRGHRCLVKNEHASTETWEFEVPGGIEKVEVSGPFATNDFGPLMMATVQGLGIAFVPEPGCYDALERGAVVRVLPEFQSPPTPVQIVFPSSRLMTPKVRSFIDFMEVEFRRWQSCPHLRLGSGRKPDPRAEEAPAERKSTAAP